MRWIWIDRLIEFESGKRAVALKNISLGEEYLHDHFPGHAMMPGSLVVEGLAQTGGLLVTEYNQFLKRVVLAKIGKIAFHFPAMPGDTLKYTATMSDLREDGAIVHATSHVGERLQAEADLIFGHLDDPSIAQELMDPADWISNLRMLRLYDIGHKPDGSPLEIPDHLLQAEREANAAEAQRQIPAH